MGPLPSLPARQQSGQAVLEGLAALSVARPAMLTASRPVAALAAGLQAASWSTAPPLAPVGPLSAEPAVLGKGWFAAPRAPLLSMTGLWARRKRPFPMGLTVPEHPLADPR